MYCKTFDPFYKSHMDTAIQYSLLSMSLSFGLAQYRKNKSFWVNLVFWTAFQVSLCSCITQCNGISIIYCAVMGYCMRDVPHRKKWIAFFALSNILSINYILEDYQTLIAHVLALGGGFLFQKYL
jgi:hypothetical protein